MSKWRATCLLPALLCGACGTSVGNDASAGPRVSLSQISADKTSFRVATSDGRVLRSPDLVGAVFGVRLHGAEARIRIDRLAPDWTDRTVLLHSVSIQRPDGSWRPLCSVAPDGTRAGFPVAGRSLPDGTLAAASAGEVEVVCTSGAQGKCLRLGYHPWAKLPNGASMLPVFNACVRMIRADYAGRGLSQTRNGTTISFFDRVGIHPPKARDRSAFEAGWDEHGAVCVRRTRIAAMAPPQQIEASSPRLAGRVGAMCTPDRAKALGALIFNSSRV